MARCTAQPPRNVPAREPRRAGDRARLHQLGDLVGASSRRREHLLGVLAERRARARARVAGRAVELDRQAELAHGRSAPGWSSSTTISRARTSSESSASSSSSTGSRQQSCSAANASHSARVRSRKIASTCACASEPGASNCCAIRSSRPTPRHHACQNFGSSAPQRDPAVGALVRAVADQRAGERQLAAPRHDAVGEVAARRPSPATTARRRPSRRRRSGPRRERSRSRSAARIPNGRHQRAAAEVGDLAGGLHRRAAALAGQPEQADRAPR